MIKKPTKRECITYWVNHHCDNIDDVRRILEDDPTDLECIMGLGLTSINWKMFKYINNPSEEVIAHYYFYYKL